MTQAHPIRPGMPNEPLESPLFPNKPIRTAPEGGRKSIKIQQLLSHQQNCPKTSRNFIVFDLFS